MISSRLKKTNDFMKLLTNPGQVAKDLEKLTEKEKSVRAQLKELREGKSKKAYLEGLDKKVKEAEDRLKKVEEACKAKLADVDKEYSRAMKEMEETSKTLGELAIENKRLSDQVKYDAVKVEAEKKRADSFLKKAIDTKDEADKLKWMYEGKVKDLNERFKGLS